MTMARCKNALSLIILWALVALIGRVQCKCSLTLIADDERTIAYACIHSDLDDLGALSSDTEWIEFSVSRIENIPEDAFARFRNLRRLAFYNCNIRQISPNAFRGLNHLEWLVFHGTRINVARAAWFQHLPNLRRLILDKCDLVHVEPEVYPMLPNLEILGLRDNDLDCLPIEGLSALRMLRTVRIDGNPWTCTCRQQLERFFNERRIVEEQECRTCLNVHQNLQCMTQFVIPVLPPFTTQNVTLFKKVPIAGSHGFETSALSSLDRLPDKTTWIQIFGLRMGAIPKYAFFRFGNSLRSLEVRDCGLRTVEPGAFAGLHKLERLILIGNQLHDVGADWFRDLLAVRQLVLQSNQIEYIDNTAFSHMAGSLRHLDIRNNRLRCLPIETLSNLRSLERIEISENPWLCACRDVLERFLINEGITYQIIGRCYHNENEIVHIDERWQHGGTHVTGTVRWGTIDDIHVNITRPRPRPTTPRPVIVTEPPRPPSHQGSCVVDTRDQAQRFYTCSGLTSLSTLNLIPVTAQTIRIIRSNVEVIKEHAFSRFGVHLVRLEFQDCGISEIENHAFYELSNLQYLILGSNELKSITAETVDGLTNLKVLDLSRNNIMRITNGVFDVLPNLVSLDVSDNVLNCIGIEHLAQHMPHLRDLKVDGNPWSCLCGQKIAKFLDDRRIPYDRSSLISRPAECLYIPLSGTTPHRPTTGSPRPPTPTFPVRPVVPTVVYNNTIEGSCTKHEDANGTRYRCIGGNINLLKTIPPQVTAIEFHEGHLAHLPAGCFSRFYNLQELVIWNCGLHTVEPGAFDGLRNLRRLTIRDNPLLIIGSNWFVLPNLEMLDLRGNSVKYIEPDAFKHLQKVVYLNLEGNDLKCIFTSDLDSMPIVHTIEFSGNPLKWRCRVELEQFLETRRISYVKVENSCEGKKLVRNLLWNRNDNDAENCSTGSGVDMYPHNLFMIFTFVYFCVMLAR